MSKPPPEAITSTTTVALPITAGALAARLAGVPSSAIVHSIQDRQPDPFGPPGAKYLRIHWEEPL